MNTFLKIALGVAVVGVAIKVGYTLFGDDELVEVGDTPDEPVVVKDTDGPSVDDLVGEATVVPDDQQQAA
jgi:hypothetical protein